MGQRTLTDRQVRSRANHTTYMVIDAFLCNSPDLALKDETEADTDAVVRRVTEIAEVFRRRSLVLLPEEA